MHEREFGPRIHGRRYGVRPGAYVVWFDAAGRYAAVRTVAGCFLPGGGIDPGESPAEAACREVREETGHAVELRRDLGEADEIVLSHELGFLIKRGAFFLARVVGEPRGTGEDDHELVWLDPANATRELRHESHAWGVREALLGYVGEE